MRSRQHGTPETAPGSRADEEVGPILLPWVLRKMLCEEAGEASEGQVTGGFCPWRRWFQHLPTPLLHPHTSECLLHVS